MCIALSAAVVLSLASCGSNDSETPSDVNSSAITKTSAIQTTQTTAATEYTNYTDYTDYPEYGDDDYYYNEDYGNYNNYDYGYVGGYDNNGYNDNNSGNEQAKTTKKKTSTSKAERLNITAKDIGYAFDNIRLGFNKDYSSFENLTGYTVTGVTLKTGGIKYEYNKTIKPSSKAKLNSVSELKYSDYCRVKAKDSTGNEYEFYFDYVYASVYVVKIKQTNGRKYIYWYNPTKNIIEFVYDEKNDYSDLNVSQYGMKKMIMSPNQIDSLIDNILNKGISLTEKKKDDELTHYVSLKNNTDYRILSASWYFCDNNSVYCSGLVDIDKHIPPNNSVSNIEVWLLYVYDKDVKKDNIYQLNVEMDDEYGNNYTLTSNDDVVSNKKYLLKVKCSNGNYWAFDYDYNTKTISDIYYQNG